MLFPLNSQELLVLELSGSDPGDSSNIRCRVITTPGPKQSVAFIDFVRTFAAIEDDFVNCIRSSAYVALFLCISFFIPINFVLMFVCE